MKVDKTPKIAIAYDCELRLPGCAIIQAALGGPSTQTMESLGFHVGDWSIEMTPGMRLYVATEAQWRDIAALAKKAPR